MNIAQRNGFPDGDALGLGRSNGSQPTRATHAGPYTCWLLAGWALLPHLAYRIAPSAFVNAELMRVTAPMAGRLANDLPRKGDMIDHSITVNLTETLAPDRRHLLDLEQQSAVAKDRAELAKQQLAELTTVDQELATRTDAYQEWDGPAHRPGDRRSRGGQDRVPCRSFPTPRYRLADG